MHFPPERKFSAVKIHDYILPSKNDDWTSWFNYIIETVYLGKNSYAGYKNNVKGNLRIIAAFQVVSITTLIGLLLLLMLIQGKVDGVQQKDLLTFITSLVITFFASIGGIFLKEKNSLYEKWKYLAGLYNDIIQISPHEDLKNYPKRELLNVSLAIDILSMEMWSHESFAEIFKGCLSDAIRHYAHKRSAEYTIEHLTSTGISKDDALFYLENYQDYLLSDEFLSA